MSAGFWRQAGLSLCAAAIFSGCQSLSGVRLTGLSFNEKSPYAGAWTFSAAPQSSPAVPGCSAQWGPFTDPVSVAQDGTFDVAAAEGSIDSNGAVSFSASAPAQDACGGGTGRGRCASANLCQGTFDGADGASSSWRMAR